MYTICDHREKIFLSTEGSKMHLHGARGEMLFASLRISKEKNFHKSNLIIFRLLRKLEEWLKTYFNLLAIKQFMIPSTTSSILRTTKFQICEAVFGTPGVKLLTL